MKWIQVRCFVLFDEVELKEKWSERNKSLSNRMRKRERESVLYREKEIDIESSKNTVFLATISWAVAWSRLIGGRRLQHRLRAQVFCFSRCSWLYGSAVNRSALLSYFIVFRECGCLFKFRYHSVCTSSPPFSPTRNTVSTPFPISGMSFIHVFHGKYVGEWSELK